MTKENLISFIELCKVFELNPKVNQISPQMVKEFVKFKLFDLLTDAQKENIKNLFSDLKDNKELYGQRIGQSAIMLLCMSDKEKAKINAVIDAPKQPLSLEYVCQNCGNIHVSINQPQKQGCCDAEKYIENVF